MHADPQQLTRIERVSLFCLLFCGTASSDRGLFKLGDCLVRSELHVVVWHADINAS